MADNRIGCLISFLLPREEQDSNCYYFGRTVSAKLHVSWLKTKLKTKHINEKTVYSKAHKREYHEVLTTALSLPINKEKNGIMEKVEKQFTLSI